jgi:hypothetical protein
VRYTEYEFVKEHYPEDIIYHEAVDGKREKRMKYSVHEHFSF